MNKRLLVNNAVFFEVYSAWIAIMLVFLGDEASNGKAVIPDVSRIVWWVSAGAVFLITEAVTVLCLTKQKRFDEYQYEKASGWRIAVRSASLVVFAGLVIIGVCIKQSELFVIIALILVWLILLGEAVAELFLKGKN